MEVTKIKQYPFDDSGIKMLEVNKKGKDWPVVYLLHNDTEIYVGETNSMINRFYQHKKNPDKDSFKLVEVMFDDEFNKSAILDIEQSLIHLFAADKKMIVHNRNGGQSEKHNYYQREKYINKIDYIWDILHEKGLTKNSIFEIKNSNLFKYSPYNTLTTEQNRICMEIIKDMMIKLSAGIDGTYILSGGAGTGKTIVLTNIIYKLITANKYEVDFSEDDEEFSDISLIFHMIREGLKQIGHELKIGYVVPMTSIRKTLKTVFKETGNGLKAKMVIGPFNVIDNDYDVVFVDEAHRLTQYKNIGYRGKFQEAAYKCGMNPEESTQLDFIVKNSRYRVLVYDENQTVKGSDITKSQFEKAISRSSVKRGVLTTQMRCEGGLDYTKYLDDIFSCRAHEYKKVDNYDFKMYENVDDMINAIKSLDSKFGLCRNAAGYSWEWKSKGCKTYEEAIKNHLEDIFIGKYKYVWNMTNQEFIISENSINEIGCIHTLQGYDLNYVGVIFGKEIDYDPISNKITIDRDEFYDKYVKQEVDDNQLKEFIINSYKVIMSRGIKGCYVYVFNKNLREYLKRYIDLKKVF